MLCWIVAVGLTFEFTDPVEVPNEALLAFPPYGISLLCHSLLLLEQATARVCCSTCSLGPDDLPVIEGALVFGFHCAVNATKIYLSSFDQAQSSSTKVKHFNVYLRRTLAKPQLTLKVIEF